MINVKNTTHYTTAFACLHRALGRHVEADDVEDRLYAHQEKLVSHHYRVAAFLSMRAELQHTSKHGRGRALAKYDNDNDVERCSRDLIQSISMDAESGSRTPSCRVSFAYFSRVLYWVLVTNVYWIVDHGTRSPKLYHCYLWNDKIDGKGPSEVMSILLHFMHPSSEDRCQTISCWGWRLFRPSIQPILFRDVSIPHYSRYWSMSCTWSTTRQTDIRAYWRLASAVKLVIPSRCLTASMVISV